MVIFCSAIHAGDSVDFHVVANEFVFYESLEIAEQPLVAQMQKNKEIVSGYGINGWNTVGVEEFQHVANMCHSKDGFDSDSAFIGLAKGHSVVGATLAKECLEVLGTCCENALVRPNFRLASFFTNDKDAVHMFVVFKEFLHVSEELNFVLSSIRL